jgi:hypothetical protein
MPPPRVGSYVRLERPAKNKHSSLFCINIETKKIDFMTVTAFVYVIKLFTIVIY